MLSAFFREINVFPGHIFIAAFFLSRRVLHLYLRRAGSTSLMVTPFTTSGPIPGMRRASQGTLVRELRLAGARERAGISAHGAMTRGTVPAAMARPRRRRRGGPQDMSGGLAMDGKHGPVHGQRSSILRPRCETCSDRAKSAEKGIGLSARPHSIWRSMRFLRWAEMSSSR